MRKWLFTGLIICSLAAVSGQEMYYGGGLSINTSNLFTNSLPLVARSTSAGIGANLTFMTGRAPWYFYTDLGATFITGWSGDAMDSELSLFTPMTTYDDVSYMFNESLGVAYRLGVNAIFVTLGGGIGLDAVFLQAADPARPDYHYIAIGPSVGMNFEVPLLENLTVYLTMGGTFGLVCLCGSDAGAFIGELSTRSCAGLRLRL